MNVRNLQGLTWIASLAVGGYLTWFVLDFLRTRSELEMGVTQEDQRALLDSIEEPEQIKDDVVDYERVRRVFNDMNWTGREAPKPVERPTQEVVAEKPKQKIADLLSVLVVRVDTVDIRGSLAYVKYLDNRLAQAALKDPELNILRVGKRLGAPHDYARVDSITTEGVRFTFEGDEREPELVLPAEFPRARSQIVQVGPDGAILPQKQSLIPKNANYRPWKPARTESIGKNKYQIGTETVTNLERDYSRILSQDVRYTKHRDPKSGAVAGIRVTHVTAGSVPEAHGLMPGDIVKSINGHKVTSVNGAIAFVKREANGTDEWLVVIENKGREFTRVYYSPKE